MGVKLSATKPRLTPNPKSNLNLICLVGLEVNSPDNTIKVRAQLFKASLA